MSDSEPENVPAEKLAEAWILYRTGAPGATRPAAVMPEHLIDLYEQFDALTNRVDEELRMLERWAGEQNAGNAFAEQVRFWALSRLGKLNRSNPATQPLASPARPPHTAPGS